MALLELRKNLSLKASSLLLQSLLPSLRCLRALFLMLVYLLDQLEVQFIYCCLQLQYLQFVLALLLQYLILLLMQQAVCRCNLALELLDLLLCHALLLLEDFQIQSK